LLVRVWRGDVAVLLIKPASKSRLYHNSVSGISYWDY
jgi:hypothetical protein